MTSVQITVIFKYLHIYVYSNTNKYHWYMCGVLGTKEQDEPTLTQNAGTESITPLSLPFLSCCNPCRILEPSSVARPVPPIPYKERNLSCPSPAPSKESIYTLPNQYTHLTLFLFFSSIKTGKWPMFIMGSPWLSGSQTTTLAVIPTLINSTFNPFTCLEILFKSAHRTQPYSPFRYRIFKSCSSFCPSQICSYSYFSLLQIILWCKQNYPRQKPKNHPRILLHLYVPNPSNIQGFYILPTPLNISWLYLNLSLHINCLCPALLSSNKEHLKYMLPIMA